MFYTRTSRPDFLIYANIMQILCVHSSNSYHPAAIFFEGINNERTRMSDVHNINVPVHTFALISIAV